MARESLGWMRPRREKRCEGACLSGGVCVSRLERSALFRQIKVSLLHQQQCVVRRIARCTGCSCASCLAAAANELAAAKGVRGPATQQITRAVRRR